MWLWYGQSALIIVFLCNVLLLGGCRGESRFQHEGVPGLPKSPRIAVIGAGVGGTGVAYFLKQLGHGDSTIDLYEKSNLIGGRLHTVDIFGKHYETGGSVIHPRNLYARDLVKKLHLRKKKKEASQGFALIKDQEVVFTTSSWNVVTLMKILWRYGLGFNHLMSFTNRLIDDFSRIYTLQSRKVPYENPRDLLVAMSPTIANLTKSHFRTFLEHFQIKETLINELVQAITFVNYGQDTSMHSFVGSIAIAGADDGLWSIENGNKQLPRALAAASGATLFLNSNIKSVANNSNGSYTLRINEDDKAFSRNYDIVVIANPLEVSQISFVNFTQLPYDVKERKYHRTVATIIAGTIRENFTMATERVDSLFTCDGSEFFTSIGRIYPVESHNFQAGSNNGAKEAAASTTTGEPQPEYPVYKVFSPEPLTEKQLEIIFSQTHQVKVFDWKAYPEYDRVPETFPSFQLDQNNLFYLNSIEWAASAIEMSLISAKNIALLVSQRLKTHESSYDSEGINRIVNGEFSERIEL